MELTEEIFADDCLMGAWIEGSQRILDDAGRDIADRVDAGCALLFLATAGEHDGTWGSIPTSLAADLRVTWELAFDDREQPDARLPAVQTLYEQVVRTVQSRAGEEILRRELT